MYQQTSILIVEDDGVLAQGLKRALKTEDREIKICGKLREAREILRDGLPDLMILDVNLPDGNGFDFLEEVKRQWRFPVILLTANDMETDIVAGAGSRRGRLYHEAFQPCGAARQSQYTASPDEGEWRKAGNSVGLWQVSFLFRPDGVFCGR